MSFTTNKPTNEDLSQSALNLQLSKKSASVPAFRPQIVRSVRMHPTLAACVAAIVLVCLVGFAMFQKSQYLAISQVYEEPTAPKLLSDPSTATFDANRYDTFLGEQIQMVQRLDVLTAALSTLPPETYREFGATPALAAEAIQAQIKVVRVASSYQMSISLKGTDPQKTADIVNAITNGYIGTVHKANAAEYDQRAQLLGEERQRIDAELQTARTEQAALGASIGVANPAGESGNPYDVELSGIRSQLVEARAAHDVAAAQLGSLSGVGQSRTDGLTAAADELIAGDAGLGSMKATISQRKAQLNEQMSGMTPSNPIYKQDQDQIADLDRTLDRMTNELRDKAARRLQDKLRTDLQRTGDIESRLNAQLARQIANATSAAPRLQRASEVAADMQRLDTRMAAVDDALRSLRLEVSGPAQVRLSLAATPPERPEANRRKQLLLLALPLALLCGIAAAVFARKQDKRIYGGVDIDEVLGFPPLAVLPARGDVSQRVFEEYVLRLAAGIESAYRTSGARTFLLTAVSLTTDIRPLASALTRKFEEIGVNIVVATASDMLAPTDGGTSATGVAMSARELKQVADLWREGFVAANVAKLKTEHGLVLIESEALLNCAQTEYVARCVDATILIVECGVTTRQELFRSAELLHRLNVTGIGAVLEEIQLGYADADFRAAIEALDRRQAASVQQDRRPRVPVPPADIQVVQEIAQPFVETAIVQPEPQVSEPATSIVHPEAETAQPEIPVVQPEVRTEPSPVVEHAAAVLSHAIAASNVVMHEKMTPRLPAQRLQRTADGDPGMTRSSSWIGRLLRFNTAPVVSIVPDGDDDDTEQVADLRSKSSLVTPAQPAAAEADYDASLANRLNQISGSLPVAPTHSPATDIAEFKESHRPQAVQPQPVEVVPVEAEAAVAHSAPAPGPKVRRGPAAWATVDEAVNETIAEQAEAISSHAVESVPTTPEPRRRLSFKEMIDNTARQANAPAVEAVPEPLAEAPAEQSHAEPQRDWIETVRLPILAHVSEYFPAAAAVEAVSTEPELEAHVTEVAPAIPAASEPEIEEWVPRVAASHIAENFPESAWEMAAAHEVEQSWESIPEPIAAEVPEFHFSDRYVETPKRKGEEAPAYEPYRPVDYDFDDIEPVYHEASRSLNTGRWDPIPPLRPSTNGWRDRPSPVPANANGPSHSANGAHRDGFNQFTPQRWIPEESFPVEPEPEPLSEPLLSRQWGLLSKFQQSRLNSSPRPAPGTEGSEETSRDANRPASNYRDHRS